MRKNIITAILFMTATSAFADPVVGHYKTISDDVSCGTGLIISKIKENHISAFHIGTDYFNDNDFNEGRSGYFQHIIVTENSMSKKIYHQYLFPKVARYEISYTLSDSGNEDFDLIRKVTFFSEDSTPSVSICKYQRMPDLHL